jgi:carbon dioxide concentrating mechanism protein CcmO
MYSNRSGDPYAELALGLISAQSFPAIVGIADRMLKESSVSLIGYEQIGSGYCTAVVRGRTPDVRLAIETGRDLATQFGQETTFVIIPRPMPNLEEVLPIGSRLASMVSGQENNQFRDQAVGLIETRGFPALVGATDAMLKSADVTLSAYHKTGSGLCTAIVRGTVANVAAAIEVGMVEADRIGELHAVMVIPRPLDDLERTLPIADCWVKQLQPLKMPLNVEATVETRQPLQPLELPIAEPLEIPVEIPVEPIRQPLRLEPPIDREPIPFEPVEREPIEFEPIELKSIEPELLEPEWITPEPAPFNSVEPETIDTQAIEILPLEALPPAIDAPPAIPPALDDPTPSRVPETPEPTKPPEPAKPAKPAKGFNPRRSRRPRKP